MKYYHYYMKPMTEVNLLRLADGCLQQEEIGLSNPNKVTQPGGEINAGEGIFDDEEYAITHHSNLWED